MALSVGQNLASKPVAFGAQTEKKNELPKQAAIVAGTGAASAAVGATVLAPKVLTEKSLTMSNIAKLADKAKGNTLDKLDLAFDSLRQAGKKSAEKVTELKANPKNLQEKTQKLTNEARKQVQEGYKAAKKAIVENLPVDKMKGAVKYGAIGAGVALLGVVAAKMLGGNKEAAPAQPLQK